MRYPSKETYEIKELLEKNLPKIKYVSKGRVEDLLSSLNYISFPLIPGKYFPPEFIAIRRQLRGNICLAMKMLGGKKDTEKTGKIRGWWMP